ncbi:hypothetical protein ITJ55_00810 [Frigoribacterium sp. VKM Ac-1396]|uniref:hypothetical protein n=1 Tax=Frigoribacterium sp. VKM Ac-1396 TaxID=2783821 RepID=UPI00188D4273|nr:hypothetical protein [Frigoribacterium sp. VKM Ac-1396]MBF4599344.1 hypothetical protein [Frigoribacterium sp. VKM Ac-1396]
MVIAFNDTTSPQSLALLDPGRPWLPEAATFINVTDEPGLDTDLQIFCSYSPATGLAVHELGVILRRDRSDLGTAPFSGIDVRDVLRRALRAHADHTLTDDEIEQVLPRTRSDPETYRPDPVTLTVRAFNNPWSMIDDPVSTMVTPDLCVPTVIEVLAQDLPEISVEIKATIVLDAATFRYRVIHIVIRHHGSAQRDLGADPLQQIDLGDIVRTALVGIAPTGPGGPTTRSFLPLPLGDR